MPCQARHTYGPGAADNPPPGAEPARRLMIYFLRLTVNGIPDDVAVEEVTRRVEAAVRYGYARRSISERTGFEVRLDVLPEGLSGAIEQLT